MKKSILKMWVVAFLLPISIIAQTPLINWQHAYGGSQLPFPLVFNYHGRDQAESIQATNDGGYIVTGISESNDGNVTGNAGQGDFWIVKLNYYGNIEWQKAIGGTSAEHAYSIEQTNDGGYIVAGTSRSNDGDVYGNHGDLDYWIVKLNSSGGIMWQNSLGGSGSEIAQSVKQTSDGGYIVAGYSNSNDGDVSGNHGDNDIWVVKLNSIGSITWQRSYGGSGFDAAESIVERPGGGYAVVGYSDSNDGDVSGNHGTYDLWGLTLFSNGAIHATKSLGGSQEDGAFSIATTPDGGYIVAGTTNSNNGDVSGNHGSYDYWVVKLGYYLDLEWQKTLGSWGHEVAYDIERTSDQGYIVAGTSNYNSGDVSNNNGGSDYWVVKLSTSGNIIWEKNLGGSKEDYAYSIAENIYGGGYTVAGVSYSNDGDVSGNHGQGDFWIVNLYESGAREKRASNPISVIGLDVYPNPAEQLSDFQISLTGLNEESNQIAIQVYDLYGKEVYQEEFTYDGSTLLKRLTNADNYSSGMYLVNITVNGKSFNQKLQVK